MSCHFEMNDHGALHGAHNQCGAALGYMPLSVRLRLEAVQKTYDAPQDGPVSAGQQLQTARKIHEALRDGPIYAG
jgi:hypothetical protein